jgi:hypothetical protein
VGSRKRFFASNDSVPLNIWVASTKQNKNSLKTLVTTTDLFRIGFVEDICFRTAVLDGIVSRYFQIRVNHYIKFAS